MWLINVKTNVLRINRKIISFKEYIEFEGGLLYRASDVSVLIEINERNKEIIKKLETYIQDTID